MKARLALTLAMASLWHRKKVLALVCLTLTLSVSLLLGIQYLRTEVKQSFTSTISGTDLIVGARSGQLNLLLYTVFHIGDATNNIRWSTYQSLKEDSRLEWLIPISLGDSYRGNQVGAEIVLSHGGGRTSFSNHEDTPFTVTGILAPTGTPVDQAVYISLDGMEAMHVGWESGVAIPGRTLTREQAEDRDFTPDAITAAFVGIERQVLTFRIQREINQFAGEPLSAILPGVALSELWRLMGQFERALLGITGFVVITSLIGLIAVLLTLQAQRAHEIAVLRATGASPALIASLYILECVALALAACVLALIIGMAGLSLASPWLLANYGMQISLRPLTATEWTLLAAVRVAACIVALIPAFGTWRQSRRLGFGEAADQ